VGSCSGCSRASSVAGGDEKVLAGPDRGLTATTSVAVATAQGPSKRLAPAASATTVSPAGAKADAAPAAAPAAAASGGPTAAVTSSTAALPPPANPPVKPSPAAAAATSLKTSAADSAGGRPAAAASPAAGSVAPTAVVGSGVVHRASNTLYPIVKVWWLRQRLAASKEVPFITSIPDLAAIARVKNHSGHLVNIFNWNPSRQKGRIFADFDRTALQLLGIQLRRTGLTVAMLVQAIMLVLDDIISDAAVGGALCFNLQTHKAWDATVRAHAARYERIVVNVDELAFDFADPVAGARTTSTATVGGAGTSSGAAASASSAAASAGSGTVIAANPYAAAVAEWWDRVISHKNISGLGWVVQLAFVGTVPLFKWSTRAKPECIAVNFQPVGNDRLGLRALAAKLGLRQNKSTLDLLSTAMLMALSDMVTRCKLGPLWCEEVERNETDFWKEPTVSLAAKHTSMAVNVAEGTLYFCKPKSAAGTAAAAATGKTAAAPSPGAGKR